MGEGWGGAACTARGVGTGARLLRRLVTRKTPEPDGGKWMGSQNESISSMRHQACRQRHDTGSGHCCSATGDCIRLTGQRTARWTRSAAVRLRRAENQGRDIHFFWVAWEMKKKPKSERPRARGVLSDGHSSFREQASCRSADKVPDPHVHAAQGVRGEKSRRKNRGDPPGQPGGGIGEMSTLRG